MPDRIQREVEELLERLDTFPPKRPLSQRIRRTLGAPFRAVSDVLRGRRLPHISAGHVLLATMALIVVVYVAGGSGGLWRWIIAGSILVFIGAFLWSLRRNTRTTTKYWRDRPMDLRSSRYDDRKRR